MPLLSDTAFEPLLSYFENQRVGLLVTDGNVGDYLIRDATIQLFQEYQIDFRIISQGELERSVPDHGMDIIAAMGGGNLGDFYPICIDQRKQALAFGKPIVVLPQSIISEGENLEAYKQVFLREEASLYQFPTGKLAPDMALALVPPMDNADARYDVGIFLRKDVEKKVIYSLSNLADPVDICSTVNEYFELASHFRHIVTDRLHFAIAGLILGREVTLLPNSYHKNRSMFDTWLKGLGCNWAENIDGIVCDSNAIRQDIYQRLAAVPAESIEWTSSVVASQQSNPREFDDAEKRLLNLVKTPITVDDIYHTLKIEEKCFVGDLGPWLQKTLGKFKYEKLIELESKTDNCYSGNTQVQKPCYLELNVCSPRIIDGTHRISAQLIKPSGVKLDRWFQVPEQYSEWMSQNSDPFLLSCIYLAMQERIDIRVNGAPVSKLLLRNLREFQQIWKSWNKNLTAIEIRADSEEEMPTTNGQAVLAFSGGVDSVYSAVSRLEENSDRLHPQLVMAVHIGGMDQTINDARSFFATHESLKSTAKLMDLPLIPLLTNIRHGTPDWENSHGSLLAAALHSLSAKFTQGIISSTAPYELLFPWGSNPVSDHWLSSHRMEIWHEGAGHRRFSKIQKLQKHPDLISNLRVCWRNRDTARNCGVCGKCRFTIMALQSLNMPLDAFYHVPSDIETAKWLQSSIISKLDKNDGWDIVAMARENCPSIDWLDALEGKVGYRFNPDGK